MDKNCSGYKHKRVSLTEQHGEQMTLLACPSQICTCQKGNTALRIILLNAANFAAEFFTALSYFTALHSPNMYLNCLCPEEAMISVIQISSNIGSRWFNK